MRTARRTRSSLKAAVVVGLGIATLMSSAPPASASTLAASSISCDARRGYVTCDVYFSGGTGGNTYWWNQPTRFRTDYADHTSAWVVCDGTTTTVAVFATDSSGTTASVNHVVDCFYATSGG